MTVINIGELTKSLSVDLRITYNNIPWKSIAGMRDMTAHKYQALKMGDVWVTVINDIPILKDKLIAILRSV